CSRNHALAACFASLSVALTTLARSCPEADNPLSLRCTGSAKEDEPVLMFSIPPADEDHLKIQTPAPHATFSAILKH
ncbi:MAG TPA: hypothetical protein VMU82_07935, partial [Acetobacteraceae bacterium]|nr:hypothetical protein [Acetobacteraceae bacterium]